MSSHHDVHLKLMLHRVSTILQKIIYSWLHKAPLLSVVITEYDGRTEELNETMSLIMEMEMNGNIW